MPKKLKLKKPIETCHLMPHGQFSYYGFNNNSHQSTWDLVKIMSDENSYIHEHLMTLHFIATEFNCKNIVEVGTGAGQSTIALALAALKTGGHVTTIDVEQCIEAKDLIKDANLREQVTFLEIYNNTPFGFNGKIDLLFIDGNHTVDGVREDIIRYLNGNIEIGGWVIFHDTNNPKWKQDVIGAISVCSLIQHPHIQSRKQMYKVYEWLNCNGLIVLKRYE